MSLSTLGPDRKTFPQSNNCNQASDTPNDISVKTSGGNSLHDNDDWVYSPTATTEYAQLDIDDSETVLHRPLLEETHDEDAETKVYRLPSEGGSIFVSFVRLKLNMANSIIGAGIIGLPFSFKEASLSLAGRTTYQDLLEFSFGRTGLIAISVFQFAFAFGGMCAYCVIIGDTIPHVIRSLVPSIEQIPVLWVFGNRRLCITIFTVFVSYPLSLYRDIAKLAKTSALALVAIIVIIVSVVIEGPKVPEELRGSREDVFNFMNNEVFQAIAVISFG
ncbi:hypothetical protein EC973_000995 [Apophysomyces ossiformis]|uniref:Amino acid transporter transmembrane domain-containing protein n=1 Tax=Apophysomyces ossiformis TaxID=679940 RepID=A0A8H7BUU5_9FUNG|nr:hypothetical protein EC973_000995 [Apophysomyces ossiformis]